MSNSAFHSNSGRDGGAVAQDGGSLTAINTFFYNNQTTGGSCGAIKSYASTTTTLTNVTISKNTAKEGYGGGICHIDSALTLNHVTVSGNTSTDSFLPYAFVVDANAVVTVNNSIIAGNNDGDGNAVDCVINSSATTTFNSNLIGIATMDSSCQSTENFSGNPALGSWSADHLPLGAGSPARSRGTASICAAYPTDQRGQSRPATNCDLGAVQYYTTVVDTPEPPRDDLPPTPTFGYVVPTLTSGEDINDDPTDSIAVTAEHGLTSGIEFQRRDTAAVLTTQADNIEQVKAAGVVEVIDIWSYAEQNASTCFDNSLLGTDGGIVFVDKSNVQPMVDLSPPLTSNGNQTCIQTSGPGYVVVVQNASQGAIQPAASAASAGATATPASTPLAPACMVTTTHIINFRASPGGPVIQVLPYNVTLSAFESANGWVKVDYHGLKGWISADYVIEEVGC